MVLQGDEQSGAGSYDRGDMIAGVELGGAKCIGATGLGASAGPLGPIALALNAGLSLD